MRKESVHATFFFVLLGVLALLGLLVVAPILDFVLLGFLLAIGFHPLHRAVRRVVHHPPTAAFATIIVVSVIVIVPLVFVTISLINDLEAFITNLSIAEIERAVGRSLGAEDAQQAGVVGAYVVPKVTAYLETLAVDLAGLLARMVVGLMVLVFVMYYALAQGPQMVTAMRASLPLKSIYKERLIHETKNAVDAIFFGQILISVVHGVVLGIGFWLFGIPSPVFWGFVTIIISILPVVGTPAVWLPAGIWLIVHDGLAWGLAFMVFAAVLSTGYVEHVLKFRMIGKMAAIHPLLILIGVVGGIGIFGMSGFLLGPLALALLVSFTRTFAQTYAEDENYVFL